MEAGSAVWKEYESAAKWCAQRGLMGKPGDALPTNLSRECLEEINNDPDAFSETVAAWAYAIKMEDSQLK